MEEIDLLTLVWEQPALDTALATAGTDGEKLKLKISPEQFEADLQLLVGWFREGIAKLPKLGNVLVLNLGDCPEIFSFEAHPCLGGQSDADSILEKLSRGQWIWDEDVDLFDFDAIEELCYYRVDQLPHAPWSDDDETEFPYQTWDLMAHLAIGRAIREGLLTDGALLGPERTAMPLLVGFEDAHNHIATLTRRGWERPAARRSILL